MLKGSLCCRKFVPAEAPWTLTSFVGPEQLHLGLCSHPAHRPEAHLNSALETFHFLLVLQKCWSSAQLQLCLSLALNTADFGPQWIDFLTQPQTSFITTFLLMDWVLGCHPQTCPACCAWLLQGCTLTVRHLPCQLRCAWLLAPHLSGSRWLFLYSYSNYALANKIDAEC